MQVNLNGLNLNFEVFGEGQAIVILHGWQDNSSSWHMLAKLLSEKYRVFLINLPGFGGSDTPSDSWGIPEYAEILKSFIKELEIKQPVIIGHSVGGKIASWYSHNNKDIKTLILISPSGVEKRTLKAKLLINTNKLLRNLGLNRLRTKMIGGLASRDYKEAGHLRPIFKNIVETKIHNVLPKIKTNTLILWGDTDEELNYKYSKVFKRLIPNASIKLLYGETHFPYFENPELVSSEIIKYLNESN